MTAVANITSAFRHEIITTMIDLHFLNKNSLIQHNGHEPSYGIQCDGTTIRYFWTISKVPHIHYINIYRHLPVQKTHFFEQPFLNVYFRHFSWLLLNNLLHLRGLQCVCTSNCSAAITRVSVKAALILDFRLRVSLCTPSSGKGLISGVPRGVGGSNPPEIPKALQNRAKLNPIVKTVKNC